MRTDALHRRVVTDLDEMMHAVGEFLPAKMPARYEGRSFNLSSFIRRMNGLTEPLGVFNERADDLEMPKHTVVVSGLWLPKAELPENGSRADVRLLWHVHPSSNRISLSKTQWDRRRFYFWQRLAHELIHRHQDAHRGTDREARTYSVRDTQRDIKMQQAYYGNYDELEAYAHDAALEFITWLPDMSFHQACDTVCALPDSHPVGAAWTEYLSAFDRTHPAAVAFKRKTKAWWDTMRAAPSIYERLELPRLL